MQLTFNQGVVWLFATPNELIQMAAIAQQKITESQLGESLTILEGSINRSNLIFRISASKDSGDRPS